MSTAAQGVRATAIGRASWSDIAGMALFALRGNWMRSILTALGVIIGIACRHRDGVGRSGHAGRNSMRRLPNLAAIVST
jgi:hypothetical protein